MVISLSAKGLTHGEIAAHLAEVYGAEVSKQTITAITDRVMEGLAEWQSRPLDAVYAVIFIDAINVKIREGLEAAKARGRVCGARAKLSPAQAAEVRKLYGEGRLPRDICELFGISRATLYRYLGTEAERAAQAAS